MQNNNYIKKFPVNLSSLSENEKEVLALLTRAAELIAPIYAKQVNDKYLGANFYPHDATKEEIQNAAKHDPQILNPQTIIERDKNGKLIAIPYHEKYSQELEIIAKILYQAAEASSNKEFAKRVKFQAETLLNGTYEMNDISWLTMPSYKISLIIGPEERYEDRLLYCKGSYTAAVGIIDETESKELAKLKDTIMGVKHKSHLSFERIDLLNKTQFRIDNTVIFAGLDAKYMFVGADFPHNTSVIDKYGAQLLIFKPSLKFHFEKELHPIYHKIFEKKFQKNYTPQEMFTGELRTVVLSEIGRCLTRYRYADHRLRELYPIINEIASSVVGIKACGALLLKGAVSQKELEAILVMFFCEAFRYWQNANENPSYGYYSQGFALALNYFVESGAVRSSGGFSWPNFTRMFVGLTELADILEKTLAFGSYEDAKSLIEKYNSPAVFAQFLPQNGKKHPYVPS